jgi:hypothetical protein
LTQPQPPQLTDTPIYPTPPLPTDSPQQWLLLPVDSIPLLPHGGSTVDDILSIALTTQQASEEPIPNWDNILLPNDLQSPVDLKEQATFWVGLAPDIGAPTPPSSPLPLNLVSLKRVYIPLRHGRALALLNARYSLDITSPPVLAQADSSKQTSTVSSHDTLPS